MARADDRRSYNLELYEKLVATTPDVERKGDTMPYTSVNGRMFRLFTKEGHLSLRLPAEELEAFLKKYKTERSVQYGMVMKEYAEVPDSLLEKTLELSRFFNISYEYVKSLKPKPAKKKAAVKKR